ncbi:mediator of rna polymerase ii transcription subunit 5 [Diaporthe eres]|nr:mediator of rna polymerase ii transcription subunit 5 [Diaporthe eres]
MGDSGGTNAASRHEQAATSRREWERFLQRCLVQRLDFDKFAEYAPLLHARHPLGHGPVADLVLRPTSWNKYTLDPRVPHYMQTLLDLGLVDTPAILAALYRYSTCHVLLAVDPHRKQGNGEADGGGDKPAGPAGKNEVTRWQSSFSSEEVIFYRLTKAVAQGLAIRNSRDALDVSAVMARWMTLFTAASAAFQADDDDVIMGGAGSKASQQRRDDMDNSRAAFVMLLLGVCENPVVLQALGKPFAKGARKALSQSLASFIPSIMQTASQIAARLELFRTETLAGFEPIDKKKEADNAEMDELLDETLGLQNLSIPDLHVDRSRAGLYIYLNAALVGRPLIDDASFYNYLHNRYQGDIQLTAIDLILASFDVLANAIFKNEGQKTANLIRSYLINKVPLILASFATQEPMYPFNSELCITNALSRVDTNTFPTLTSLFENNLSSNPFTESVRSDFVTACCLHGLVPETSIDKLIGDYTYQTLPAGGRYNKDKLVQECLADPLQERIQKLVTELENMDGNVGACCQALTEMLGKLCANKETMSLKTLCSKLVGKPLNLDVLLLFDKPTTILSPLCELLDNWGYEDDQGEYQPVYEEFGSVLLLLLAFVYRYNLSASDLGIRSADSFVAKLLANGQLSRPLDELNDQEKNQLNGWIHGLFDTDGGGLADDLLSSCPPQDLYLLIPTLFHNIVLAFSTGHLTEETLKTGIEYLVEPFLGPSLVTGIMYLSNCLWTDRPEENRATVKILQLIIRPSQKMSPESSDMLNTVKNIVAKPLESGLRTYQRQNPRSQDVEPLLQVLKGNVELSRRTGAAGDKELEQWTSSGSGGLTASVRNTFQNLTMWSLNPGVMPTAYAHRQILVGLKLMGARRLLQAILEELKQMTETGNGSIAYDVAIALVCAPDVSSIANDALAPTPPQRRLSLREALKWEAEEWKKTQKKDPAMAETVVRLYQKVEAQMTPAATMAALPHDAEAAAMANALVDDAAAVNAAASQLGMDDPMALDAGAAGLSLDLGGGGGDLSLGGSGADSAGGLDLTGGDDMFSALGPLDGWDSMDLT